jgi:hypothetical protein
MEITMMKSAERYHILVADLLAHAPSLGKAKVMGMGGLAVADEAGKLCDAPEMRFVTDSPL